MVRDPYGSADRRYTSKTRGPSSTASSRRIACPAWPCTGCTCDRSAHSQLAWIPRPAVVNCSSHQIASPRQHPIGRGTRRWCHPAHEGRYTAEENARHDPEVMSMLPYLLRGGGLFRRALVRGGGFLGQISRSLPHRSFLGSNRLNTLTHTVAESDDREQLVATCTRRAKACLQERECKCFSSSPSAPRPGRGRSRYARGGATSQNIYKKGVTNVPPPPPPPSPPAPRPRAEEIRTCKKVTPSPYSDVFAVRHVLFRILRRVVSVEALDCKQPSAFSNADHWGHEFAQSHGQPCRFDTGRQYGFNLLRGGLPVELTVGLTVELTVRFFVIALGHCVPIHAPTQ